MGKQVENRLKMPGIFADGMVFQQQKEISVWGIAGAGTNIMATIIHEKGNVVAGSGSSTSDNDGNWNILLEPLEASFDKYKLVIESADGRIAYNDILIGEVFLTSGQSNMEFVTAWILGGDVLVKNADNSNIRFYGDEKLPDGKSDGDFPYEPQFYNKGWWWKGDNGQQVASLSGISYTFALRLFEYLNSGEKNIPIAILSISLGGSTLQAWMPRYSIDSCPEMKKYLEKYNIYFSKENWNTYGIANYQQMSALFNLRIAPVMHYKIRGFLWHQGEGNTYNEFSANAFAYGLSAMVAEWRRLFGGDEKLPFIYGHIAPYDYGTGEESTVFMWEGMDLAFDLIGDNVSQIPIYDLTLEWKSDVLAENSHPIHTLEKQAVGDRMALALYNMVFDKKSSFTAPKFHSMEISSDIVKVKFDYAGEGLKTINNDAAYGFAICGEDRKFVSVEAQIVDERTVEIKSDLVKNPVAVTYAFSTFAIKSNLQNSDGIPAVPFRSDKVPSKYVVEPKPEGLELI
ncbi:MAG: sialate O-acetylesterase [Saccharofermentanales bacterium]